MLQPNRVVAILTPLVFAPLAGYITLKLADAGIHLGGGQEALIVQGLIFALGVLIAWLKSQQWLKGWQKWEERADEMTNGALDEAMQKFLEELAHKTGTPLPTNVLELPSAPGSVDEYVPIPEPPTVPTGEGTASAGEPPPAAQPGAFGGDEPRA